MFLKAKFKLMVKKSVRQNRGTKTMVQVVPALFKSYIFKSLVSISLLPCLKGAVSHILVSLWIAKKHTSINRIVKILVQFC